MSKPSTHWSEGPTPTRAEVYDLALRQAKKWAADPNAPTRLKQTGVWFLKQHAKKNSHKTEASSAER